MVNNTGGPAFPIKGPVMSSDEQGMTMRDYFAAKAMQGMLAAAENYQTPDLAMYAYQVADAMIKAREAA